MGMLILSATGPKGEQLALAAGESLGIAVGFDPEFESATFDSDEHDENALQEAVFAELDAADPDWRSQLELAE
jgi:hypothetical protein